jgi:alpha-L-fucosidase
MTMNGHWGYNAYDDRWKTTTDLLQKLIDIVSKGGNFLLNVGPNAYGIIPEVCQQNLREMGDWLNMNGDAIYGTTASPFPYLSWGRATRKGQKLYLHVFDWPKDGKLALPLSNKITKAYLMADSKTALKLTVGKDQTTLHLPAYAPDKIASVVVVDFEGEPQVAPAATQGARVQSSSSQEKSPASFLLDGDPKSLWKAVKGEKSATLEIELPKPLAVQCISLVEPWHPWNGITQKLSLQYFDGKNWLPAIAEFTSSGSGMTVPFKPVLSNKFRLIIQNEKEAPALNELILFRAQ